MSHSFRITEVGPQVGTTPKELIDDLIRYADNFGGDVVRIGPDGSVSIDGVSHGDMCDFTSLGQEVVGRIFTDIKRRIGMAESEHMVSVGTFAVPCAAAPHAGRAVRAVYVPRDAHTAEIVIQL